MCSIAIQSMIDEFIAKHELKYQKIVGSKGGFDHAMSLLARSGISGTDRRLMKKELHQVLVSNLESQARKRRRDASQPSVAVPA